MAESTLLQPALAAARVLLAEPLVAVQRCAWGFTHETWLLTTPSRSVILQLPHPSADVGAMIASASYVPGLFARQGLHVPRLLHAAADHDPPFLLREYIAGQPGVQWLGNPADAERLAKAMGRVLRRLALLPTDDAALPRLWAAPQTLAEQAQHWLAECSPFLNGPVLGCLREAIDILASQPETAPVLAHGDFCPVNVIVAHDDVVGLIDVEAARVAGPLFDAAWWGWVMRYHHPKVWSATWPVLLEQAGLSNDDETVRIVEALQLARCLELCAEAARQERAKSIHDWAMRLTATSAWGFTMAHGRPGQGR